MRQFNSERAQWLKKAIVANRRRIDKQTRCIEDLEMDFQLLGRIQLAQDVGFRGSQLAAVEEVNK